MDWWRRLSIAAKLPIGIGTLLFVVLGGMTAVVFAEVRQSALRLAEERLNRSGLQFATTLSTNAEQQLARLNELARWPVLAEFLITGDVSLQPIVAETLQAQVRRREADVMELWSADGRRVMTTEPASSLTPPTPPEQATSPMQADAPAPTVGRFEAVGEGLFYPVSAAVRDEDRSSGYVIERHRIVLSEEQARAVSELVGTEARLLVGNAAGDVWTDLGGVVEGPPAEMRGRDDIVDYETDAGAVMARGVPVRSTPWLVVLEFVRAPVLAPAQRFLIRSIVLSVLLAAAGAAVAWFLSRRVSVPLQRVTEAAETMAAGRTVDPVSVRRQDEIGRLAASFNTMARQVAESTQALELRVAERTAALEAANRELEAFSYSVSHDLRAPLRAVDGFAAVLVEDHAAELTPEAQRCVGRIRSGAQQMGQLIDDLLTFSRLGRQTLTRTQVEMETLVRGVVAEQCAAQGRDVAEFTIEPLPSAFGERSMLKQVVANYVDNALKFTRDRRPVTIDIGGRVEGGETVYWVRDNGVGFDMRYAGKLFGVFQRLHSAEDFQGTGVGLAIVKRVIERHGGRVWAEAEPGAGATFYFTLPTDA